MKYFLALIILTLGCTSTSKLQENTQVKKPKNIILLIGDGMGLGQITAGLYSNNNFINIERFPVVGLHKNYSYDNLVTDSAAGATAFSCGVKSYNGAIGVDHDTIPVKTILEDASDQGLRTGMVASCSIVHATPGSFGAHNRKRANKEEIAADLVDCGADLMIGGGKSFFDRRTIDDRNLYEELRSAGYKVSDYFEQDFTDVDVSKMGDKWAYFTADKEPLSREAGRDYLIPASEVAIDYMDKTSDDKGFFLMIEGSQIDWAGHANNFPYLISELLEYDQVIKRALDFAEKDGNTLVILTADHETGGFSINNGSTHDEIIPAWTSDYHTGIMIPVFAYGPGSEKFAGIYENTAIYDKMMSALQLKKDFGKEIK